MRAAPFLSKSDIRFQAGINEDLAATAVWGTQQAELRGEGKFDGVFAMWYGKGPGVDRTGDVFRHANLAGTAKNGGVLALMGDDHTAESSTTAHQSEYHFIDVMIPILNPAGVQEVLDYGLYGWAMSRFTGSWVALKTMHETIESTAVIDAASIASISSPRPISSCRKAASTSASTIRSWRRKRGCTTTSATPCWHSSPPTSSTASSPRAAATRRSASSPPARAISTSARRSTSSASTRSNATSSASGFTRSDARGRSAAANWPTSPPASISIIVVEEKRSLIEVQVREELYGTANQPVCIGKRDEAGNWLFPVKGALDSNDVAICIGERLLKYHRNDELAQRVARLKEFQRIAAETRDIAQRIPYFCSGCPHNSSTVVPEGMRAYAGIGCHFMAQWMDRSTLGYTQMGGEGANWVGEAPFSTRAARVSESRRRHLQSLRLHGDPRRHRLQHQHHLQDSVQRRGGDDRRPGQ